MISAYATCVLSDGSISASTGPSTHNIMSVAPSHHEQLLYSCLYREKNESTIVLHAPLTTSAFLTLSVGMGPSLSGKTVIVVWCSLQQPFSLLRAQNTFAASFRELNLGFQEGGRSLLSYRWCRCRLVDPTLRKLYGSDTHGSVVAINIESGDAAPLVIRGVLHTPETSHAAFRPCDHRACEPFPTTL